MDGDGFCGSRARRSRWSTAIVGFGVFSSSIGVGALPTTSLPIYGDTTTERVAYDRRDARRRQRRPPSRLRRRHAVLRRGRYRLRHRLRVPRACRRPQPHALRAERRLGLVHDHRARRRAARVRHQPAATSTTTAGRTSASAHRWERAPTASAPVSSTSSSDRRNPRNLSTNELNYTGYTNAPTNPAPHSPLGSRYEGFQPNSHTGTSVAAMPDVNDDGRAELAIGMPDASLHIPGGGGAAVLYGTAQGEHINLADLWEAGYPYYFHVDLPTLDQQHVGETVASVPDMTGDGSPDLAIGTPQSDLNGIDSGSVWIINGRLPAATGCRRPTVDATCPWIRLRNLTAVQGYRIDGAAAGDGLGSSIASVGDQNGDGRPDLAIGASSASPYGRSGAGQVVIVPGQSGSATRNLAVSPPLQLHRRLDGRRGPRRLARPGRRHGRRRAHRRAGRRTGRAGPHGRRVSPARRARHDHRSRPGDGQDRRRRRRRAVRQRGGRRAGARRCRRRRPDRRPWRGRRVHRQRRRDAQSHDARRAARRSGTCAGGAGGRGARDAREPRPAPKKPKKLKLCPLKKPKTKYKVVNGKRVKVKPAPCRARPKTKSAAGARGGQAMPVFTHE